ncbi:hypothetical protein DMENIID0001_155310 [Sergentomyia squamirostris]
MDEQLEGLSANKSFKSGCTADDGFKFQEEILLHLAIRFSELKYEDFTIGYEVKRIKKFDDVVCEIMSPSQNYFLLIQTKHLQDESLKLEHQHFFSPDSDSIKGEDVLRMSQSPHFGGKSLLEYFKTEVNSDFLPESYLKHIYKDSEEIFLHLAIRFSELKYENFTIGYDVQNIPKFDDIVCHIKTPSQNCFLVIQAKHLQDESLELEHQHFFSPNSDSIKGATEEGSE